MSVDSPRYAETESRWDLWRTVIHPKSVADRERLNSILAEGWEPFAASPAGQIGDVYYFRRMRHIDGSSDE